MELNEKLLKFQTGLVQIVSPEDDAYHKGIWTGKDGMRCDTPDFTTDLNAIFRWLVPELLRRNLYIGIGAEKSGWECWIFEGEPIEGDPFQEYEVKVLADTPAMAICKAIETLIGEVSCRKE